MTDRQIEWLRGGWHTTPLADETMSRSIIAALEAGDRLVIEASRAANLIERSGPSYVADPANVC